jgi:threonine aldolase
VQAFLVVTGTAANALALSTMVPAYGAVYCHEQAHVLVDECGAVEFYTGGARLIALPGAGGKLSAAVFRDVLIGQRSDVHYVKPGAVTLTQATEFGTLYQPDEIRAISELAHARGLHVHMDGTRFANAVAALGCTPAESSWRAGVDVLCFGASKNGALAAEAVVFFDRELARDFGLRRKRGGHLLSKMRFVAAQFDAYLEQDRWRSLAAHANAMARLLGAGMVTLNDVDLAYPVETNLVFVTMPEVLRARLEATGYELNWWPQEEGRVLVRLVTAFNTREEDVARLIRQAQAAP